MVNRYPVMFLRPPAKEPEPTPQPSPPVPHCLPEAPLLPPAPRLFRVQRTVDLSGCSGVGTVAQGVEFSNGRVAVCWLSPVSSIEIWRCMADCVAVHGHDGATEFPDLAPAAPGSIASLLASLDATVAALAAKITAGQGDPALLAKVKGYVPPPNPPSWVASEASWEKAKAAVDKDKYQGDLYWQVVTTVYKEMGGIFK